MKVDWIRIVGCVFQGFWKQLLQGVVIFTLDIGSLSAPINFRTKIVLAKL